MDKKYLTVYENIKKSIVSGAYAYGDKLPSKRVVAEKFGFSILTVEHAYELLTLEGYILPKERSGFFVSYKRGETFGDVRGEISKDSEIDGEKGTEQFPFSVYASAIRFVLSEYGEKLYLKSQNTGTAELKKAICDYLARNRGIFASAEQIVIGSGAENLYGMITELFSENYVYAIEEPSYEQIERVYTAKGVKIERLELGADGILTDFLKKSNADILHVTPFRSFPTKVSATAEKKNEYLAWASERSGRFIVEDDYESEFSLSPKTANTIFEKDKCGCVIYINTFSNTIAPSLRVGYMVLPNSLVETFNEKLGFYSCSVPVLEQYLIAKLLNDGSFERHLNRVRRLRKEKTESEKK